MNILGELAALGAVGGWTGSALAFEAAGKRIGSLPVNIIRLAMAMVMLTLIALVRGRMPWPSGIGGTDVLWLLASGFVGFFLGDLLLFQSYLIIGSRLAMLVMSLSPPLSALLDRLVFGTGLAPWDAVGMAVTIGGVVLAISTPKKTDPHNRATGKGRLRRAVGFLLAFGGAVGQSGGMILGKLGLTGTDPLAATFVRTLGGLAGFLPLMIIIGATGRVVAGLKDGKAMAQMSAGAVAGPVLGVTAILVALLYSPAGVVSAITAIVPVIIILPSAILLKDKPAPREIIGALVAVAGVALLFLT